MALIPAERRPVLVAPGYAHPARGRAAARWPRWASRGDVRLLGWVDDAELEGLYALAALFVFPSLYEGFGLPVLEAMARGVPVACSDRALAAARSPATRRCCSTPSDAAAIAAAIERLLADGAAADCAAPGGPRARAGFTWERTAAADAGELPARAPELRSVDDRRASVERQPLRVARRTTRRSTRAAASPAAWTRTIAAARSSGEAEPATNAVDALLDQLDRGVVGVAHDARSGCRSDAASTTTSP